MSEIKTEGPTTGQGTAAGGVDKAKEAALADQKDQATPESTPVPGDATVRDTKPGEDVKTTSGEPATADAEVTGDDAPETEGSDDTIEDEAGDDTPADAPDAQAPDTETPTEEAAQ